MLPATEETIKRNELRIKLLYMHRAKALHLTKRDMTYSNGKERKDLYECIERAAQLAEVLPYIVKNREGRIFRSVSSIIHANGGDRKLDYDKVTSLILDCQGGVFWYRRSYLYVTKLDMGAIL